MQSGKSKTKWRCLDSAFYTEMLLRFPSIPSNQVSGESGRGNFTDFWATQYDRQSIWSNFKEIESPTDLYSLPGLFIKLEWQTLKRALQYIVEVTMACFCEPSRIFVPT